MSPCALRKFNRCLPQKIFSLLIILLCPIVCHSQTTELQAIFSKLDKNSDGKLSLVEAIGLKAEGRQRGDYFASDLDENGTLSPDEYELFHNIGNLKKRSSIPDPIQEHFEKTVQHALKLTQKNLDQNSGVQLDLWETTFANNWWGSLYKEFDKDESGRLTEEEIRHGFSVAFGIHDHDGIPLRFENGTRFDWRHHFVAGDTNADGTLDKQEFEKLIGAYRPELKERSLASDVNGDGIYSCEELIAVPFHSRDPLAVFRKLDATEDGALDQAEIATLPAWQQGYTPWVLRAFDSNKNQKLSLTEFLKSPLAVPYLDWSQPMTDLNQDGVLTLDEFHPGRDWQFLGISAIYFSLLDTNNDQRLNLSEFRFKVEPENVHFEDFFDFLDVDANDEISFAEFFPAENSKESSGPIFVSHQHLFERADRNGSGTLSREEFDSTPQLFQAYQLERQLRSTYIVKFQKLDIDKDAHLSFEEISQNSQPRHREALRYVFNLVDANADGVHDFNEFMCYEGRSNSAIRGPIEDPVTYLIQSILLNVLPSEADPVTYEHARKELAKRIPNMPVDKIVLWDRNSDQKLSLTELRIGLEDHFGVWHPSGLQLRKPNGTLFAYRSFQQFDTNSDQQLSEAELKKGSGKSKAANHKLFASLDRNGNGMIELLELENGTLFWSDLLSLFQKYDQNQDLKISESELKAASKPWEQPLVKRTLKAFDKDNDQHLSFLEFRSTPFANLAATWVEAKDLDFDGRLSRKEFTSAFPNVAQGEANWMFSNFDLDDNHFLNRQEYPLSLDTRKIPAEIVFEILDQNQDQQLTIEEAAGERPEGQLALARYDSKIMRIEDAWRHADNDGNRTLSLSEFIQHQANLLAAIHGTKLPQSSLHTPSPPQIPPTVSENIVPEQINNTDWRIVGLIGFNVLILITIIFLMVRPKSAFQRGNDEG